MGTFKNANVVMLATNEKATVNSIVTRPSDNRMAIVNVLTVNDPQPSIHQHLYIVSDDEIKEGDWVLSGTNTIVQCMYPENVHHRDVKKIIATTDTLSIKKYWLNPEMNVFIPQPSKSFIEKFVDSYNKNIVIDNVLVEYENGYIKNRPVSNILKVNTKDNTITIKKVKDSWSRDEVISLLSKFYCDAGSTIGLGQDVRVYAEQWINKNI